MLWWILGGAAVAGILWLAAGRYAVTALDRVYSTTVSRSRVERLRAADGRLMSGSSMDLPDFDVRTDAQGRALLRAPNGETFVLGTANSNDGITPEPGDEVWFEKSRSAISWPSLFDFNFMTGHSPSKKRNQYYRLSWTKSNGARLEMEWRYEQWFYDGLATAWSEDMAESGTGLNRVRISGGR